MGENNNVGHSTSLFIPNQDRTVVPAPSDSNTSQKLSGIDIFNLASTKRSETQFDLALKDFETANRNNLGEESSHNTGNDSASEVNVVLINSKDQ